MELQTEEKTTDIMAISSRIIEENSIISWKRRKELVLKKT